MSNFRCSALSCYSVSQPPLLPRYSLPHTIVLFPRFTSSPQSIHKEELPWITISSRFLLIFIRCLVLEDDARIERIASCKVLCETFVLQLSASAWKWLRTKINSVTRWTDYLGFRSVYAGIPLEWFLMVLFYIRPEYM